jgi:hypothetical protein
MHAQTTKKALSLLADKRAFWDGGAVGQQMGLRAWRMDSNSRKAKDLFALQA